MAIIKKYKSKVVDVKSPIEDIYVVTFEPVEKKFKYKPGQFLHLALDEYNPSMQWPDSRCFSIQSSPESKYLSITFSVKGQFTKRMAAEIVPSKELFLKLPYGELFSSEFNKDSCVFIAGGTGISPYLSLFTDPSFALYNKPKLYLGVRDKSSNIYDSYLSLAKEQNKDLLVSIINQQEKGILNIEEILKENGQKATYFISGPPLMIKNFKEYLLTQNVMENSIRTDDWE